MRRLFFSLYFVVVLALLLIGWTSEQVWRFIQSSSDNEVAQMAKLSKMVRLLGPLSTDEDIEPLAQTIGVPITLSAISDIAWLDEQLQLLRQGEPVLTYDEQDALLIYLLVDPLPSLSPSSVLIQLGPIAWIEHDGAKQRLLILLSYVLLAVVIGLWSRPLWRDLRLLQQATEQFGQGPHGQQAPQVSKNSVIAPVVDTFKVMSARISRLVEEQKELTNAVSHELRTPLARLKFSLALLQPNLDSNDCSSIKGMSNDINELEALVDEMLSYSRLESDGRQLLVERVDMRQLLDNLVEKLGQNTPVVLSLECDNSLYWRCDGHFIERALQNLITNAIRYAQHQVVITLALTDVGILFSVADDGCGIAPVEQGQIFKPFVRLDKSRARHNGGFGLGLAIVKRIVDWHQGRVWVSDSVMQGAKFNIELPLLDVNDGR